MGLFQRLLKDRGGGKKPFPKSATHILQWWNKLGTLILYLKKIQKIYESRYTSLEFYCHQHFFSPEISKFCYIKKDRYNLHLIHSNSFNFLWVFKGCFNKHGFINHNFFHAVTNKILSRDSNYFVDVVMWPKFGNSSFFMREVIITSIL